MVKPFSKYIGIDYSGAETSDKRLRGLRVYMASGDGDPIKIHPKANQNLNWTRQEVAQWCLETLNEPEQIIIGIDHGFSFPISYFQRYNIADWSHFLIDFQDHWPTDQNDKKVEDFRHGNQRTGNSEEYRITETWTSSAQSVFRLDGQGSVGKSTHAGLPWILYLRKQLEGHSNVHFWPFDGFVIPVGSSVVAEAYPSLYRRRYRKNGRNSDEHDAWSTAKWLQDMDRRGVLSDYFKPPLTNSEREIIKKEGWILGVR